MLTRSCCIVLCLHCILCAFEDNKLGEDKPQGPLSPRDEQATFRIAPGFRVELTTPTVPQSVLDAHARTAHAQVASWSREKAQRAQLRTKISEGKSTP